MPPFFCCKASGERKYLSYSIGKKYQCDSNLQEIYISLASFYLHNYFTPSLEKLLVSDNFCIEVPEVQLQCSGDHPSN